MSKDAITIKDLKQLRKDTGTHGLTILEWKAVVKAFAIKHELTDREAIDLAQFARQMAI